MKNVKFTIVTVCYNAQQIIEKTILSVLSQQYDNVEYIIIDGNSSDHTLSIINKYHNQISTIVSEPDKGIYDAMNKGIKIASGDYINFMNAGDTFVDDEVLTNISSIIIDNDKDVYFGDEIRCYKWGKVLSQGKYFSKKSKGLPFGHQSSFVRTSLLKDRPFNTSFKILADQESMTQLFKANKTFMHIRQPIAYYDMYGLSNNVRLIYKENAMIQGANKYSYYWGYGKCILKSIVYKIIPNKLFCKLQAFRYRNNIIIDK